MLTCNLSDFKKKIHFKVIRNPGDLVQFIHELKDSARKVRVCVGQVGCCRLHLSRLFVLAMRVWLVSGFTHDLLGGQRETWVSSSGKVLYSVVQLSVVLLLLPRRPRGNTILAASYPY